MNIKDRFQAILKQVMPKLNKEVASAIADLAAFDGAVDQETKAIIIITNDMQDFSNKVTTKLLNSVTRLTVVDKTGRVYEQWDKKIVASFQDDYKTLKLFID